MGLRLRPSGSRAVLLVTHTATEHASFLFMVFLTCQGSIYHDLLSPYLDVFCDLFYEFLSKDEVPVQDYWTKEYDLLSGRGHVAN